MRLGVGVEVHDIDGSIVLIGPRGDAATLNETASRAFRALLDGVGVEHVLQLLADVYGIDAESIRRDVEGLLVRLMDVGMVIVP